MELLAAGQTESAWQQFTGTIMMLLVSGLTGVNTVTLQLSPDKGVTVVDDEVWTEDEGVNFHVAQDCWYRVVTKNLAVVRVHAFQVL